MSRGEWREGGGEGEGRDTNKSQIQALESHSIATIGLTVITESLLNLDYIIHVHVHDYTTLS